MWSNSSKRYLVKESGTLIAASFVSITGKVYLIFNKHSRAFKLIEMLLVFSDKILNTLKHSVKDWTHISQSQSALQIKSSCKSASYSAVSYLFKFIFCFNIVLTNRKFSNPTSTSFGYSLTKFWNSGSAF